MSQPVISVRNLSKSYTIGRAGSGYDRGLRHAITRGLTAPFRRLAGKASSDTETIWALKDVSFDVQPGEMLGIIGRNGAGKSTLLKILSRITCPTAGAARIHGRVASLLEVGTGFHHELTGRENIFLNGAILGMTRAEVRAKFDEIVAFSEIEKFLDTPVKYYSSGMYVRLAFAVAAHLDPEILLVDEVLAVGDVAFQKKCMGKMNDVATRQGRTVLFVSHNMVAIETVCQNALLIQNGAIKQTGPSSKVVNSYLELMDNESAQKKITHVQNDQTSPQIRNVTISSPDDAYQNAIPYPDTPVAIGLWVNTESGQRVFYSSSSIEKTPKNLSPEQVYTCVLENMNLAPGIYRLTIAIPTSPQYPFKIIEDAGAFRIIGDSITNRSTKKTEKSIVMFPAKWTVASGTL